MHFIVWEDEAWVTKPAPCFVYCVGQGNSERLRGVHNVGRYFHLFASLMAYVISFHHNFIVGQIT